MESRETFITATSAAILPLGVDGHPLHDRQDQIRAVVQRRLGGRHALLLAEAQRRPGTAITDWYTDASGPKVAAGALDEPQRAALRAEVDGLLVDIDRLGEQLEGGKGTGARTAGRHLRLAARRLDDDSFVYRIGEQPVLVAWGHDGSRPVTAAAPLLPPPMAPVEQPPAPAVAEPAIIQPVMAPPVEEDKHRRAVPWMLLAAGLAWFLAGLGIAWVLTRFLPITVVQVVEDLSRERPILVVLQTELDRLREENGKLRATLASMRREFEAQRALCPPPPKVKPPEERVVCTRPPQRGRMVVVFDTSNSMGLPTDNPEEMAELERRWGSGDRDAADRGMELVRGPGHKRIDDARTAALDLVEAMPPNIDVGLVTFVTRCEVGVDVRPGEPRDEVVRELRRVMPRASTPLAASLRLAMTQLSGDPAVAASQSVVVITDGHEGCGGDPCAAARDLKSAFPSVKVHVIDVVGISRLQCVADITGGSSVGARDTAQLKAAVRRAQAAIEQDACR